MPLEPIRNLPFPLPSLGLATLPLEVAKASLELQAINDSSDHKKLENVKILIDVLGNGRGTGNILSANKLADSNIGVERLIGEATKRRRALARIILRFGGSLTSIQAKRLRERVSGIRNNHNKVITERLAGRGADALEALADAISSLDNKLSSRK